MNRYLISKKDIKLRLDEINKRKKIESKPSWHIYLENGGFYKFCNEMIGDFFTFEKTPLIEAANVLENSYRKYAEGNVVNVMINMPPRTGKSLMVSCFILWVWMNNPELTVMRVCYGQSLFNILSKNLRGLLTSRFQEVCGAFTLRRGDSSVESWSISSGNPSLMSLIGGGIDGAITGLGADIGIIDDPAKNYKDGWSNKYWDNVMAFYDSVYRTRRAKKDRFLNIIVSTKWTKNDICSRLYKRDPDDWIQLKLKALITDENGNQVSSCEAVHKTELLLKEKAEKDEIDPRLFGCLYQQEDIDSGVFGFSEDSLMSYRKSDLKTVSGKRILVCDPAGGGTNHFVIVDSIVSNYVYIIGFPVFTVKNVSQELIDTIANYIYNNNIDIFQIESQQGGSGLLSLIKTKVNEIYYDKLKQLIKVDVENGFLDQKYLTDDVNILAELYDRYPIDCKTRFVSKHTHENKECKIEVASITIHNKFMFLNKDERDKNYNNAMDQLTSYVLQIENQDDDVPDVLSELAKYVKTKLDSDVVGINS